MFTIETALIKEKIARVVSQYIELDLSIKNQYERKHALDWQKDKCVVCKLLLTIDSLGYDVPNSEMS